MSLDEYAREARKMVAVLAQHYEKQLDGRSLWTTRIVHRLTGGGDLTRLRITDSRYTVANRFVPVADCQIPIRIITPTTSGGSDETYPVLVWLHGGGEAFQNTSPVRVMLTFRQHGKSETLTWTTLTSELLRLS